MLSSENTESKALTDIQNVMKEVVSPDRADSSDIDAEKPNLLDSGDGENNVHSTDTSEISDKKPNQVDVSDGENNSPSVEKTAKTSDDAPTSEELTIAKEFSRVSGRLAIATKYSVTIGEVARRIHGPEQFNFSLLGPYLRRGRTPRHTENLKGDLHAVGLSLKWGRRCIHKTTLFSSLVEAEALRLGQDYKHFLDTAFPVEPVVSNVLKDAVESKAERIEGLSQVMKYSQEFLKIAEKDAAPMCGTYPTPVLNKELQLQLNRFSMLTHGFGMMGVRAVMELFQKYVESQIKTVETYE